MQPSYWKISDHFKALGGIITDNFSPTFMILSTLLTPCKQSVQPSSSLEGYCQCFSTPILTTEIEWEVSFRSWCETNEQGWRYLTHTIYSLADWPLNPLSPSFPHFTPFRHPSRFISPPAHYTSHLLFCSPSRSSFLVPPRFTIPVDSARLYLLPFLPPCAIFTSPGGSLSPPRYQDNVAVVSLLVVLEKKKLTKKPPQTHWRG